MLVRAKVAIAAAAAVLLGAGLAAPAAGDVNGLPTPPFPDIYLAQGDSSQAPRDVALCARFPEGGFAASNPVITFRVREAKRSAKWTSWQELRIPFFVANPVSCGFSRDGFLPKQRVGADYIVEAGYMFPDISTERHGVRSFKKTLKSWDSPSRTRFIVETCAWPASDSRCTTVWS